MCDINCSVYQWSVYWCMNQDLQQAHTTRQSDLLYIPRYSSKYAQKLPEYLLPKIWNKWARSVPQNSSRNIIKNTTKSKLLMSYPENVKCENVRCIECHRRQWCNELFVINWHLIISLFYFVMHSLSCSSNAILYICRVIQLHLRVSGTPFALDPRSCHLAE